MKIERVVVDTSVLISAALFDESVPARARNHAVHNGKLIATGPTVREFAEKVLAPKFDAYVSRDARQTLIRRFLTIVDIVPVIRTVSVCRDPGDDKFLEAALNGSADVIITGDKDLLALRPFRGIAILTPGDYLARVVHDSD